MRRALFVLMVSFVTVIASPHHAEAQCTGTWSVVNTSNLQMPTTCTNVGVGAAPTTKLDVAGDVRVTAQTVPTAGAGLELEYLPSIATGTIRAYDRSLTAYGDLSLNDSVTIYRSLGMNIKGPVGGNALVTTDTNSTMAISHTSSPIVNTVLLRAGSNDNLYLGANNAGVIMINKNGNVGIGGSYTPSFQVEVNHNSSAIAYAGEVPQFPLGIINNNQGTDVWSLISFAQASGASVKATIGAQYRAGAVTDLSFGTNNGSGISEKMRITGAGYVGIGTGAPTSHFGFVGGGLVDTTGANASYTLHNPFSLQEAGFSTSGNGVYVDVGGHGVPSNNFISFRTTNTANNFSPIERMRITSTGDITMANNLTVSGNLNVTGNITGAAVFNSVYQDIAEWVPASTTLPPGTVVVLDPEKANQVMPSHKAYDTTVAGVVSAQPGVVLGRGDDSKAKVATVGRVRVRVDATKHAIRIGDLLVTSDTPGVAMVSEPVDLGGIKIHRPGTLIGKALEPLNGGEGEVLVLLSLQ